MDSKKPQIEELQNLQESLELQRRLALALILELQDGGAGPENTEKARLKLAVINQELEQCKFQVKNLRRQPMAVKTCATPEMLQTINMALQKAINAEVEAAVGVRDEAEVKLQVLAARKVNFEKQEGELTAEITTLKQEISRVLGEGGDPSDINRQVRTKTQEVEDLEGWITQLQGSAIPEAEKALSEAQTAVWRTLLPLAKDAKVQFKELKNEHLAKAAELSDSWTVAFRQFQENFRTGRLPTATCLDL